MKQDNPFEVNSMEKSIIEDLKSIWENDFIKNARNLNQNLGTNFNEYMKPGYFCGKKSATTVLIMLNPGADDSQYRFSKADKRKYHNLQDFIEQYDYNNIHAGDLDIERMDNFDLKQAAFLHEFSDLDFKIPREFWNTRELKKIAKRNILMEKLQLELIPYCSRKFESIIDSPKNTKKNYIYLEKYLIQLLNIITAYPRKHILFCSKQFFNLFNTAAEESQLLKNKLIMNPVRSTKIGKLTVRYNSMQLEFNQQKIKAEIIHTFSSRALPNAFAKMSQYGKFCYEEMNKCRIETR